MAPDLKVRGSTDASPARRSRVLPYAALAIVLIAAAGLRLHHLDTESVWLDESFSVAISRTTLANIVAETGQDVHPPLHYFLLFFWGKVAGGSVWAARLLSVLFSVGLIGAAYAVASRLRSTRVGLIAAVLLAVSVFQIEFAQEARMYALLALLSTLSVAAFIRLLDSASPRGFIVYVVVTALMVYTHAYAAFVLAGQAGSLAWIAARERHQATTIATRWVLAMTCVLVAFLPWLAIFTWQFSSVQRAFWIPEPAWSSAWSPFLAYAGSKPLLWCLGPLAGLGLIAMWRARRPGAVVSRPITIVLPWLLAPIALPFLLSRVSSPIFLEKYTIAASVPFALLAAEGLALVPLAALRAVILAGVVIVSTTPLRAYYDTIRKDNWRAAVPAIEQQARPDDLLVFYPYFHQIPFDFYRQRSDLAERAFPLFDPPPPADGWAHVMERATGQHPRVWLITMQGDPTRAVVIEQFRRRFVERSHLTLQHIDVYLFEKSSAGF
ncbi:MAG: glycosyltransferase family 39 protein [Acidobacteriota bacterium]